VGEIGSGNEEGAFRRNSQSWREIEPERRHFAAGGGNRGKRDTTRVEKRNFLWLGQNGKNGELD